MIEITIEVEGMMCGMCESHVNDCVRRACRVKKVASSRKKGNTVVLAEDGADTQAIVEAIKEKGYTVGDVSVVPYEKRGLFGRAK